MSETYFNLKKKLEELSYNNHLPVDAVPLVECIIADLLQTTRSLQHYMDLAKEALQQRDSLILEAEPYRCDNAKLIQENNKLNQQFMQLKEDLKKNDRESKRKIKSLTEELMNKEATVSKLKHDVRELGLRGLCADTLSFRNKTRKKENNINDATQNNCMCKSQEQINVDNVILDLRKQLQNVKANSEAYYDEIELLKSQVVNRDDEILRLNMLLEGGRPFSAISRDCCGTDVNGKNEMFLSHLHELEASNEDLNLKLKDSIEKQHEAMLRALNLADKNKVLEQELQKVDSLALKVEEDCNKRIAVSMKEFDAMQMKLDSLITKNLQLEKELLQKPSGSALDVNMCEMNKLRKSLNIALNDKEALRSEVRDLIELNKSLQEKIFSLSKISNECYYGKSSRTEDNDVSKYATKDELQKLLENERIFYENHLLKIQDKITGTVDRDYNKTERDSFVKNLHNKLCESEQKLLLLKKENEKLKININDNGDTSKHDLKGIIDQLNAENAELSRENIALSRLLSHHKKISPVQETNRTELQKKEIQTSKEIDNLKYKCEILYKDKQEYMQRYKDATELADLLKRDLAAKQAQYEQLEEENRSYKVNSRTGRASSEHLKEECHFLREQIKKMQSDVIKEKTMSSQIKNLHIETERSNNEVQNELLNVQKQLSVLKDRYSSLEKKCEDLRSENLSLQVEKSNLLESIKKIDKERDKLVIELDNKTEAICMAEQKFKSKLYEIERSETEITDLKRKLSLNKVSEHKLMDYETQIHFLNGEVQRISQQFENAIMENKKLQNNLANVNSTLKVSKIEYDKSRKEVEGLRQQLQHYVAEVRRIEDLLSQKEVERSDMLEHFASLSVEANMLENNNHSLENESASKTAKLQNTISKVQELENKLTSKDNIIDSQSAQIASMTCKMSSMENEIKLMREEKSILEKNISYLKQLCHNFESERKHVAKGMDNTDSELQLYEERIKNVTETKAKLEIENHRLKEASHAIEELLSVARREVIELKLALQDATSETKVLKDQVTKLLKKNIKIHEVTLVNEDEIDTALSLGLGETFHEISHEEDDEILTYHEDRRRYSCFTHGGTI